MKRIFLVAALLYVPASHAQAMLAVTGYDNGTVNFYTVKAIIPRLVKSVAVGKNPTSMCLDGNGSHVFASVSGDKRVAVIEFNTQTIVATLSAPTMQFPAGCAVSPDSKKVYVTDSRADTVFVFSTESWKLLRQITVGKEPTGALFSPDEKRLLIANADSKTLSVIDPATDTVVQTVKTGTEPHAMAYTPDGKTLIVTTDTANNGLLVVDLPMRTIVFNTHTEYQPYAVVFRK